MLPDASVPQALQAAERIRAQFEGRPAETAARIKAGYAVWADVVKRTGMKGE